MAGTSIPDRLKCRITSLYVPSCNQTPQKQPTISSLVTSSLTSFTLLTQIALMVAFSRSSARASRISWSIVAINTVGLPGDRGTLVPGSLEKLLSTCLIRTTAGFTIPPNS